MSKKLFCYSLIRTKGWLLIGLLLFLADSLFLWHMKVIHTPKTTGEIYCVLPQENNDLSNGFTPKEIESLEKIFVDYDIMYKCTQDEMLQNIGKSVKVHRVVTTANINQFETLQMKEGSFFMEEERRMPSMVVDEQTAFKLWGTTACLGETITSRGKTWEITGIVTSQRRGDKTGSIYLLGSHMEQEIEIKTLWIRCSQDLESQNLAVIKQMLTSTGHDVNQYQIFHLSGYSRQVAGYWQLLQKGIGLILLVSLLGTIFLFIQRQYWLLQKISKQYYVVDYMKAHAVLLVGKVLALLISLVGILAGMRALTTEMLADICNRQQAPTWAYHLPSQIQTLKADDTIGMMACFLGMGLFVGILLLGRNMLSKGENI